ncbi:MAG: acyl-CoA/acyl-ACP dehydrogenase [Sphingomonadales bacterium]|nr:acyl-CoA/acyl-ACP dehydrogenase [Sphingomonadales bacterium]
MDFGDNEDIAALRDLLQRFIVREATPEMAARWDREDHIEREMLVKLAGLGVCALTVPQEFGGMGRRVIETVVTIVELAKRSTALAGLYIMNACYGSLNLASEGTDEQKQRFLPRLLSGETLFAYGLSEPDVGADLASVTTRAERRGDTVVINGRKRWCSGANFADHILMLVRSGEAEARYRNLSMVLVPTDAPGLTLEPAGAMGVRGIPVNDVLLDEVEVPFANVLGGEAKWNEGWSLLAGPALEIEKLETPALALGVAEAAVAEAWEYSQQRRQFGAAICTIQSIRHMLSDVQTKLQACRLMLMSAAWKVDQGLPSAVDTSMAKLFVSDTARDVVLTCQQVLGAYGYAHGFAMERYVRDALVMPIWGGSSAIQKNNIANLMRLPRK